ncbi:MAG TPA: metallophosphatase, partial [Candidatus Eremiobacteraeota bacterium]|nr:metallophosphatase [Candidatus Eremiobacteraeota bacterium]
MTISGLNEINKPVLKSSKPGQDISNTTTIKDSVELSSSSNQSQDLAELSRNQNLAEFVRKQVQSQLVNLKFIHINDFHGYVDEYRIPQEDGIVGGITRVGTEIKKLKEENPEGAITLNGGDIFEGGSYTKYTQGEIISKTFQNIGFDATVIGNHDMSWGLEAYADIAKACGGDFLGANVVDYSPEKHLNFLKPYKIIEKQGVKVGIIGLTTHMTSVGPYEKKIVDIESPEITAEKYIKQLKNEDNVDMVVVLSHLGLEKDKELAEKVKGIDVIVGAHCHTALKEPEKVGNTLIVQAGTDGKYVGNLDIVFDREKKNVVSYDGKLIPVTTEIKQDPEVKSIIAPYIEKYKAINNEVINKSEQDLPLVRDKRTALVNLFIDSQKLDSDLSAGSLFCIR